jgi:hypothetical protein
VPRELPLGNLDTPIPGSAAKGAVRISGWALSKSGIERIDVYLDGVLSAQGRTGVNRPDVQKVHPNYRESVTAGFDFQMELSDKRAGPHDLIVQARSKDDSVRQLAHFPIIVLQ